jgi:hypothetical protein
MAEINKPTDLNKIWASSGAVLTPDDTKIALGWIPEPPAHQFENYINKRHDTALAHINQHGIPEWDSGTEYRINKSWTLGSNGSVYYCKATNTGNDPVSDVTETYWRKVLDGNLVFKVNQITPFMQTFVGSSTDEAGARSNLGITSTGSNIITAASQSSARTALGATSTGSSVFTAASALAARTAIGVGSASDTAEGLVERATDAEAVSGVDDTRFLTPKKLKLGFSVNLAGNGHIAFPTWLSGIKINWGSVTLGSNTGIDVTMSSPFANACLHGQVSIASTSTDGSEAMHVSVSGINLRVTNPESSSRAIYWLAIGY